jgi:hypothetical protein
MLSALQVNKTHPTERAAGQTTGSPLRGFSHTGDKEKTSGWEFDKGNTKRMTVMRTGAVDVATSSSDRVGSRSNWASWHQWQNKPQSAGGPALLCTLRLLLFHPHENYCQ